MIKSLVLLAILIALFLTGMMLFTAGWERPPIVAEQSGYRGTGMAHIINPRVDPQRLEAQLEIVPPSTPLPPDVPGPTAGQIYQNVEVLGDLSVARFTRVMQAMTNWIYPEEGCAGCHNLNNLADESMYQKIVSRRMLQMTQALNSEWASHVGQTGVTCYTCHRGKAVPEYTWFNADPEIYGGNGFSEGNDIIGWRNGQNVPAEAAGLSSLPEEPFSKLLEEDGRIRVEPGSALPTGAEGYSIQATEWTYSLMMHMSTSLDVNCTYCHNSRHFGNWASSSPQRVTAWHGINMAQNLNTEYVSPLSSVLPEDRIGPTGEGRKINCMTCHQGVNKPLGGLQMVADYPSLQSPSSQPSSNGSGMAYTEEDPAVVSAESVLEDEEAAPAGP
jgi:photosynthetic reaction center cytochrome c subunit